MKRSALAFLIVLFCSFDLTATAPPEAPKPTIDVVSWLAGNWRLQRDGTVIDEQWMAPAGGGMIGMSRTVTDGEEDGFEFLQIRTTKEGLVYIARPSGQRETTFKLAMWSDRQVIFENPKHDFPQRISYTLNADGSLLAAIEGPRKGQKKRIEFLYQRVK